MKKILRKVIRRAIDAGVLGFYYPSEFSIRTCINWRMHRHEQATVDYLKTLMNLGNVFVNVGAHVGYYAVYVAKVVGPKGFIYAFEPHPDNYKKLIRNCSHLPQVRAIQTAASDSGGEAFLFEHSTSSSSHGLADLSGSGKTVPIRKMTLDQWSREEGINRIDAVLIDVEGHELSVLRGMSDILTGNSNIVVIIEYCPANWTSEREEIDALIKEIHKMKLKITRALGQVREYAVPEYSSEMILKQRLDGILDEELSIAHCNYVNIVLQR